jgi:hypothetical protein
VDQAPVARAPAGSVFSDHQHVEVRETLWALHAHQLNEGGFIAITAEDRFSKLPEGYLREHCNPQRLKERGDAIIRELKAEGSPSSSTPIRSRRTS